MPEYLITRILQSTEAIQVTADSKEEALEMSVRLDFEDQEDLRILEESVKEVKE